MSTKFCGHKTAFNPKGSNDCVPNPSGPPKTKFGGRPAVPAGPLKHYPGGAASIDDGNRRLAATKVGEGGGHSTVFRTRTAFGKSK